MISPGEVAATVTGERFRFVVTVGRNPRKRKFTFSPPVPLPRTNYQRPSRLSPLGLRVLRLSSIRPRLFAVDIYGASPVRRYTHAFNVFTGDDRAIVFPALLRVVNQDGLRYSDHQKRSAPKFRISFSSKFLSNRPDAFVYRNVRTTRLSTPR